jgi:hypothetical protein
VQGHRVQSTASRLSLELFAIRLSLLARILPQAAVKEDRIMAAFSGEKRSAKGEKLSSYVRFVFVAPLPAAGLKRLHHWMAGLLEVLSRVLAGRRIAAANMSADETFAQLHPALTGFATFGTAIVQGCHIRIRLVHVFTARHRPSFGLSHLDDALPLRDSCAP